jgi:ATP-dependent Clp protease ATP-binding subunit ClpA
LAALPCNRRSRDSGACCAGNGAPSWLESTLHRALAYANKRKHEDTTLEHLLIDDVDASVVMKACDVDLRKLTETLADYIDNELKGLVIGDGRGI